MTNWEQIISHRSTSTYRSTCRTLQDAARWPSTGCRDRNADQAAFANLMSASHLLRGIAETT